MITPEQLHSGKGDRIMNKRCKVMRADMKNPVRWSNEIKSLINIKKGLFKSFR